MPCPPRRFQPPPLGPAPGQAGQAGGQVERGPVQGSASSLCGMPLSASSSAFLILAPHFLFRLATVAMWRADGLFSSRCSAISPPSAAERCGRAADPAPVASSVPSPYCAAPAPGGKLGPVHGRRDQAAARVAVRLAEVAAAGEDGSRSGSAVSASVPSGTHQPSLFMAIPSLHLTASCSATRPAAAAAAPSRCALTQPGAAPTALQM